MGLWFLASPLSRILCCWTSGLRFLSDQLLEEVRHAPSDMWKIRQPVAHFTRILRATDDGQTGDLMKIRLLLGGNDAKKALWPTICKKQQGSNFTPSDKCSPSIHLYNSRSCGRFACVHGFSRGYGPFTVCGDHATCARPRRHSVQVACDRHTWTFLAPVQGEARTSFSVKGLPRAYACRTILLESQEFCPCYITGQPDLLPVSLFRTVIQVLILKKKQPCTLSHRLHTT